MNRTLYRCCKKQRVFRDSSAVEQEAVNFEVAGSNPVPGAKPRKTKSEL
jgi:hypothetical protein